MHVLEPSAGGGAIVRALVAVGARVTAVEIDPDWAQYLRDQKLPGVDVLCGDFLDMRPGDLPVFDYDLAPMNPPLDDGVGAKHVWRATRMAKRAVSLLRSADMHGTDRYDVLWRLVGVSGEAKLIRRPVFIGSKSGTPRSDFIVADVHREPYPPLRRTEWW
jgi:hypothetical protein